MDSDTVGALQLSGILGKFSENSIKIRLIKRFTVLFLLLFIVVQGIVLYNFRELSIQASRNKARTAAGIIRDTITSYMVLGVISERDLFLKNIKQTQGLEDIRILRGNPVIHQFGPPREMERATKPMEIEVLANGEMRESLRESVNNVQYTLIIPYRASMTGKINCMQCHHVQEGDVLGAVSITMNLTEERAFWITTLIVMTLASLVFFLGTLYMIVSFFRPYTDFFKDLERTFLKIEGGDFSNRIHIKLTDEAGSVAYGLNNMMDRLSRTLSGIRVKVSLLIGHPLFTTGNALSDTSEMVNELVKIYNFKRTVESDTTIAEVYSRIATIIQTMNIKDYAIHEVIEGSRRLRTVMSSYPGTVGSETELSEQLPNRSQEDGWCYQVVNGKPVECRAKRTGLVADSTRFPNICPNFKSEIQDKNYYHYCLPFYIGGQVGGIIQIVHESPEREKIESDIHYLKSYIQEVTPIIEARTYMDMLKKQSTIDQLTGLYNRRYLDENINLLEERTREEKSQMGILMIDIDYFKKVNDDHGHDVGDRILQGVARLLQQTVRQSDILVRFGGEEVLILLANIDREGTMEIAEKIRAKIESATIVTSSIKLKKTVSIGLSIFPIDAESIARCLKLADMALYFAKDTGRNQIVSYHLLPDQKKNEYLDSVRRPEA